VTSDGSDGSAVVNDGGTPSDPTDDTIEYTPDSGFYGFDEFAYEICDADDDCDTAFVDVDVLLVPQSCDDYYYLTFDYIEMHSETPVSRSIVLRGRYENEHLIIEQIRRPVTEFRMPDREDTTRRFRVTIKNGNDVEGAFSITNAVITDGPDYEIGGDGIEPDG